MSAAAVGAVLGALADVTTPDPDDVTPGVVGFIVTFLVAVATLLLIIDMVRRVRRVNYRAQVREEIAAEQAAAAASADERDAVSGQAGQEAVTGPEGAPRASGDPEHPERPSQTRPR